MTAPGTFAAALLLAALATPAFATDPMPAPKLTPPGNAAAHGIADAVADQNNPALSKGFAKGVQGEGGGGNLAVEGSANQAAVPAVPVHQVVLLKPAKHKVLAKRRD